MTYTLELTKPANIRGSDHGKIDAYINVLMKLSMFPLVNLTLTPSKTS